MHQQPPSSDAYDSVFLHARRETVMLLVVFAFFLAWTMIVSYSLGYRPPTAEVSTIWGMPSWVFWGVLVPWLAANAFTIWFAIFFVANDPLGEVAAECKDEEQPHAGTNE